MKANDTNKIVYAELSYQLNGLLFNVHNLNASGYKLGLIVNFRNRYLKPIRVIRANS